MKRTDLLEKLEFVSHALADTNVIPIYECFVFDGHKVSAYDDTKGIGVVTDLPINAKFAVNGKVLLGLLRASSAEDVDFKIEGHDLIVTIGKNTSKLPFMAEADFLFKEPKLVSTYDIPINTDFLYGLKACMMTSSRDLAHPAFMGVLMDQRWEKTTLYSTDGDAITSYITEQNSNGGSPMLPNTFCDVLLKFEQSGKLRVDDQWAKARLNTGYDVYGRLIELTDPVDHNEEIKKTLSPKTKFIKVPEGLQGALARARVVADLETKPTSITSGIEGFKLKTDSAYGLIEDTIDNEGMPDVIALVSAELMQRCLGLCDEMAIGVNCCAFRNGKKLFILTANLGD